MATWGHASASQIKTFRRCSRKWWFEKIAGYRSPTSAAAELGKKIHSQLENYLLTGEQPESPIALAGLHHLPAPGSDVLVEHELKYTEGLAVPLIGFIDLIELENRRVTYHKTTSDFKWAKTEYELLSDPQAIIYTKVAKDLFFEGDEEIEFRHVYYRTRGSSASMTSSAIFKIPFLEEKFQEIREVVDEMSGCSVAEKPIDVGFNAEACTDYGGCPFRGECAKLGVKTYGLLTGLIKKEKGETKMKSPWGKIKKENKPAPIEVTPRRTREQVVAMLNVLSDGADLEQYQLDKLDMKGLLSLESQLSAKNAKRIFADNYVNPPDGTPMDKRVEVALKENKNATVTMDGKVRTSTYKTKEAPKLPDGSPAKLRHMSKKELGEAFWVCYNTLDDVQRAAWFNASLLAEDAMPLSEEQTSAPGKSAELRADIRLMLEILKESTAAEGASEEYKKVQSVVAQSHISHPTMNVPPLDKDARLPEALGGGLCRSIKKADFPTVFFDVIEHYGMEAVQTWLKQSGASEEIEKWVTDGCPQGHNIKRMALKNALLSFLSFAENSQVPSDDPDPAAECPGYSGDADRGANPSNEEESMSTSQQAPSDSPAVTKEPSKDKSIEAGGDTAAAGDTGGNTLYVGCMPMNEQVSFLHDFLKDYQDTVAEDAAVPHYGLIKYNEGPKRVAALLRQAAYAGSLELPKALVCDPNLPCADAVLEILKPLHTRVVARVW